MTTQTQSQPSPTEPQQPNPTSSFGTFSPVISICQNRIQSLEKMKHDTAPGHTMTLNVLDLLIRENRDIVVLCQRLNENEEMVKKALGL